MVCTFQLSLADLIKRGGSHQNLLLQDFDIVQQISRPESERDV
jgi:hypothetical protein